MPDFDVIVVGAGPSGSSSALNLMRQGFENVLLFDRHRFPRAKTCGSGISPRARKALADMGLWERVERQAYPIKGLRLVSPSGGEVMIAGQETASVLNRAEFDHILVKAAVEEGATLRDGVKVSGLIEHGGRVIGVKAGGAEITARYVVVATGAHTLFTEDRRPKQMLQTCLAFFEGADFEEGVLEMIFDEEVMPHYAWLFPETKDRVNIGLCVDLGKRKGKTREMLERLIEKHYAKRLAGAKQVWGWRGHPIMCTVGVEHHCKPGTLLVGEANRLVNIATAEGISYALQSGQAAAEVIRQAVDEGWSPERASAAHEQRCRRWFRAGLIGGELFRRYGVKTLDAVTALGRNRVVKRVVSEALVSLARD